jgi:phosphopantothenoylcysteine decarboxylase/phosphopantothenate--cysteine ligase
VLAGRHIVLGVTGGVAAYKAAYLARRFIEAGSLVRTVMTPAATKFVGEATLAAITGNQPLMDLFDDTEVSPHTVLAAWADVIVIAPATASTISKISVGESSNALTATVLASTAPVVIAPAMHTEMWEHPATQDNIKKLVSWGYHIVGPEVGALAGGDEGAGRLADPDLIASAVDDVLGEGDMSGLNVLVTAGGTREAIDPVRFVGNRSSGKMGNAIAKVAADRGADVTLITAASPTDVRGVTIIEVESAEDMASAIWSRLADCDIAVMAAAVADFRPEQIEGNKMKRADGAPSVTFVPTPDVLKGVHESEHRPFLVGFAAETGSLADAASKAERKGVDLLVANDVAKTGSGFGSDTNEVTFFRPDGSSAALPILDKEDVAAAMWDEVKALRGDA